MEQRLRIGFGVGILGLAVVASCGGRALDMDGGTGTVGTGAGGRAAGTAGIGGSSPTGGQSGAFGSGGISGNVGSGGIGGSSAPPVSAPAAAAVSAASAAAARRNRRHQRPRRRRRNRRLCGHRRPRGRRGCIGSSAAAAPAAPAEPAEPAASPGRAAPAGFVERTRWLRRGVRRPRVEPSAPAASLPAAAAPRRQRGRQRPVGTGGSIGSGGTSGLGGRGGERAGRHGRAGGAGGTVCLTCRSALLPVVGQHVVYNAVRNEIYVSVAGDADAYANTIVVVDPTTSSVLSSIPIGSNPGALALSDDGSTLWVGIDGAHAFRKVTMTSSPPVVGPLIRLTNANRSSYYNAASMAVLRGAPLSVAVVLSAGQYSYANAVVASTTTASRPRHGRAGPSRRST